MSETLDQEFYKARKKAYDEHQDAHQKYSELMRDGDNDVVLSARKEYQKAFNIKQMYTAIAILFDQIEEIRNMK